MSGITRVVSAEKAPPASDIEGLTFGELQDRLLSSEHSPALSRRRFLTLAAATVAASTVLENQEQTYLGANWVATKLAAPNPPLEITKDTDQRLEKFIDLYNNLIVNFGTWDDGLFLEERRGLSARYATVWPFVRLLDALDVARTLPAPVGPECEARYQKMLQTLPGYWDNEPKGYAPGYIPTLRAIRTGRYQRYVDDNYWAGDKHLDAYIETGDPHHLQIAEKITDLGISQWDRRNGGGTRWMQDLPEEDKHGRIVVSNAPQITQGIRLAGITGKSSYYYGDGVSGVPDVYNFLKHNLKDSKTGLYFDNINELGSVGREIYTYNQGEVMEALRALSTVNGTAYPIEAAVNLLGDSFTFFDAQDYAHRQRKDPEWKDGYLDTAFTGIFFKRALQLARWVQSPELASEVDRRLHGRVQKLLVRHDTLLHHAGALHLAALSCKQLIGIRRPD